MSTSVFEKCLDFDFSFFCYDKNFMKLLPLLNMGSRGRGGLR